MLIPRFRKISPKLPNFSIVGAAKCGTTAVAEYCEQHPQIFMSNIKEPKFISSHFLDFPLRGPGDDFVEAFTIKKYEEYAHLFRKAHPKKAVGEASVENLYYYDKAIPLIKRYLGDVKIIILLRDPVDRAFSAYKMLLRDSRETLSFEEALEKEEERKNANWEYIWYFRDAGLYYDQVKAYLDNFPQVKIMLFDDLMKDPIAFMQDLYRFLEVRDNFRPSIRLKANSSGVFKNSFYRLLFRATAFKGMLYKFLFLNGISDTDFLFFLESIREGELYPLHMHTDTEVKLRKFFKNDLTRLEKLIGRDLSAWKS